MNQSILEQTIHRIRESWTRVVKAMGTLDPALKQPAAGDPRGRSASMSESTIERDGAISEKGIQWLLKIAKLRAHERVTEQGHGRQPEPTVCAVCITADRPELTREAVACFEAQTYQAKRLVIYDTSKAAGEIVRYRGHFQHVVVGGSQQTIGDLRNSANAFASADEVIVHWDSDEHSHPNRIAEQVALLQSSGADAVGYREMLFWREDSSAECICPDEPCPHNSPGEAWLYSNPDPRYCLGTSLCYWRKTWERKPFDATSQGEDIRFCTGLKCVGVSSFLGEPRMVARIHGGNTSTAYRPELMAAIERQGGEWKRLPEWDSYCRGVCE